ncbi:hypothetical protein [Pseudomonas sp. MWU12-2323]|uniref:hypothetical protein n=1 Tax=Pseudomonas sp. MWU12-2323 TaxID=2651296 RepID=UPI00128B2826|nr:hypothetical protein [Pseudomonas sp. MWU12-2323]MPQ69459.1 hypothetical protein [Pseudomonas sp. MWU12-2323]
MATPQKATALKANVNQALDMLRKAGYECSPDGVSVIEIMDPVMCLSGGKATSTEYKPVRLNVADGMDHVIHFIHERS